ncbi:uncharacterized protein LOC128221685 [Mya arenaria]|uniref:uncharacterized protein LOC128221685 n=1 Tax=Mya arenaria TaxID=6604 RepID=UPI0022E73B3C|nr:uncharacterized protein LOC128221685 [Mya arenaria]
MKLREFALFGAYCAIVINLNVVPVSAADTSGFQCEKFLDDENLKNLINTKQQLASPCPCYEHQMEFEYSFKQNNHCYTEWFFTDGVKQKCCYSQYGKLITTAPDAGFVHFSDAEVQMEDLRQLCCSRSEQLCESFYRLNVPDTCEKWSFSTTVQSGGDTEIESIDNFRYSFNGHGEYIFLRANGSDGDLEVQIRTDYVVPGNKDATEIVAFAIQVKNTKNSETVHIIKNTTSGKVLYLNASSPFSGVPKQTDCFSVFPSGLNAFRLTPIVKIPWLQHFEFPALPYLTVNIKNKRGNHNITGVHGLAENAIEEKYFFRNGSHCTKNCSEYEMFRFGESWSLEKYENESVFDYDLTKGNFSMYNHQHTSPRFLENLLGNLTALFENYTEGNITEFNRTCRNSWDNTTDNECLLAIARTHDISVGSNVHETNEQDHDEYLRRHDKPPKFLETMPTSVNLIYGLNESFSINLIDCINDENKERLNFTVEPDFEEYSIDNGVFNWIIGTGLRNSNTTGVINFMVTDRFKHTVNHALKFTYCGCENNTECDYSHMRDINECTSDATNRCEEKTTCNDTVGSYTCSCSGGFNIDADGRHCNDVNECESVYPRLCADDQQTCLNTRGSYQCVCLSGYSKSSDGKSCEKIHGTMYFSALFIDIDTTDGEPPTNDSLNTLNNMLSTEKQLTNLLNGTVSGFISVTVQSIIIISRISRKRQTVRDSLRIDYNIHLNTSMTFNEQYITNTIRKGLPDNNAIVHIAGVPVFAETLAAVPHKENELGLCDIGPPKTNCDLRSTHCVNRNASENYFACKCKYGYTESKPPSPIYCDDVDECSFFKQNETMDERCVHGICINQNGDWNCSCPADRSWMSVGQDVATFRCQGNYTYIGTVSFSRIVNHSTTSTIESFLLTELRKPLQSNGSVAVADNTSIVIKDVFVNLTISQILENKIPLTALNKYSYEFQIRLGEPILTDDLDRIMKTYFNKNRTVDVHGTTFYDFGIFNDSSNILCTRNNNSECDMASTVCRQSNGQTYCDCKDGYKRYRQEDVFTCQDINECNEEKVSCKGGGTCLNLPGNWTCACPQLTEPVIYNTSYIECSESAFNVCTVFKEFKCFNGDRACENNTWACNCNDGFELHGKGVYSKCTEIDECSVKERCGTSLSGICTNTIGNYTCNCNLGYFLNASYVCEDINECKSNPCGNGNCSNTDGLFECSCNQGYEYDNLTCVDINECIKSTYSCNGTCHNGAGNWSCECGNGYNKSHDDGGNHISCIDIDECSINNNYSCNGSCVNTPGNWTCDCPTGYTAVNLNELNVLCSDIDECVSSPCGNGTCNNINGSFTCTCGSGFMQKNKRSSCIDIDECGRNEPLSCVNHTECINYNGGWNCSCQEGFEPVSINNYTIECQAQSNYNKCSSVDDFECNQGEVVCKDNVLECRCSIGYILSGSSCIDMDECKLQPCVHGRCKNTVGSYFCICNTGFELNSAGQNETCIDVDECQMDHFPCGDNQSAQCTNGEGNYSCICNEGFKFRSNSNNICDDINECSDNTHICNGGTCHNHMGNWSCECPKGFNKNTSADGLNQSCSDINECATEPYPCIDSIDCINTPGSWRCMCDGKRVSKKFNDTTIECLKDFQYLASVNVNFNPEKTPKQTEIETYLPFAISKVFNSSELTSPILVPIEITNSSREELMKRLSADTFDMSIKFILHLTHPANTTTIQKAWSSVFSKHPDLRTITTNVSTTTIRLSVELDAGHEEYAFVFTVSFNLNGNDTNGSISDRYIITEIEKVYNDTYPGVSVWIEIIPESSSNSARRKRGVSVPTKNVNFIAHFTDTSNETVTEEDIKKRLEDIVNETQSSRPLLSGMKVIINNSDAIDLCNISKQCEKSTTTCTSNANKIACFCKEGFINNTKINGSYQCFSAADQTRSTSHKPTGIPDSTTSEQPNVATKKIYPSESSDKKSQTAFIATVAGLGGLVLILSVVVVVVCRQRTKKSKEAEQIQLKESEKNRRTGFEGSFLDKNYIGRHSDSKNRNDRPYPGGPFKPISNGRPSSFQPIDTATAFHNGGYESSDRRMSEPLYSKTNKPSVDVYPPSDYSNRKPFTQDMVRVFPETNGVRSPRLRSTSTGVDTGRVLPVREPKPDYDAPASPQPDYHRRSRSRDRLNMSRDSGLNGFNSSGSMEHTRSRDSHGYGSLEGGRAARRNTQF